MSAERPGEWPLTPEEVEEWCRAQRWHFAKTMADNPHYYVLKRETDPIMFQRVVLCIREFGYQYRWGRGEYTQCRADEHRALGAQRDTAQHGRRWRGSGR